MKVLQQALKDPTPLVRRLAAEYLGDLGTGATGAVPHCTMHSRIRKSMWPWAAAEALGRIGPAGQGRRTCVGRGGTADKDIRVIAADSLGALARRPAAPFLF